MVFLLVFANAYLDSVVSIVKLRMFVQQDMEDCHVRIMAKSWDSLEIVSVTVLKDIVAQIVKLRFSVL